MLIEPLYEDEHLLAVPKPAGMVVHPTYRNKMGTLLDALTSPGVPRPSIVGRLDKWTSGIVLVAKNATAHAALQRTLSAPETEKVYLAVVTGRVDEESGSIDWSLEVDRCDRRRVVVAAAGAPSLTRFERIAWREEGDSSLTLLQCRPMTGRRHQIRVHLAARGFPILGDPVYGAARRRYESDDPAVRAAVGGLSGQALHSWRLSFDHPLIARRIGVEAPITGAMAALLALFNREDPRVHHEISSHKSRSHTFNPSS